VSTHAPRTDVAADQSRPLGFDHCVIAVSDWARSDAFYRDVLGAEIPPHDELWGQYRFGDWKLNVHGPGFDGLKAGTIDDAVEHLRAHGIEIEAGPFRRDAGDRGTAEHVYFRDPDGSLLELVTYG
jgi:catechol 2,3-dioxygenase-like lactoylglutathione lyase family enzyme